MAILENPISKLEKIKAKSILKKAVITKSVN